MKERYRFIVNKLEEQEYKEITSGELKKEFLKKFNVCGNVFQKDIIIMRDKGIIGSCHKNNIKTKKIDFFIYLSKDYIEKMEAL